MLEGSRYAVETVSDGEQAVEASALGHYDAILMDCQMPGMNGFEATSAIRAREADGRHTPIIALTAGARAEDRERCLRGGMDGYLSKPVSKIQLLELLASFTGIGTSRRDGEPSGPGGRHSRGRPRRPIGRPALDENVLAQLDHLGTMSGEDLVGRLGALFLEDAVAHISSMRRAIADSDVVALSRSAHTLSGSSANLGAAEVVRLCATYGSVMGEVPPGTSLVPARPHVRVGAGTSRPRHQELDP